MAKEGKKGKKTNQQKTQNPVMKEIQENIALKDPLVQKKLKELEEQKKFVQEYEEKLNKDREDLESSKKDIEKERENMIASIKADEKKIRKEEAELILKSAKEEAEDIRNNALQTAEEVQKNKMVVLNEKERIIDNELENTTEKIKQLEKEIIDKKNTSFEDIQKITKEEYEKIQQEYDLLSKEKLDFTQKKADYDFKKCELEEDQEYIKELKEKYKQCSPIENERLRREIEDKNSYIETCEEKIKSINADLDRYKTALVDGDSLLEVNEKLGKEIEELKEKLERFNNYPSFEKIEELKANETVIKNLKVINEGLVVEKEKAKAELNIAKLSHLELEGERKVAKVLQDLNNELQERLDAISSQYKKNKENKFTGLMKIDEDIVKENHSFGTRTEFQGTLKDLVRYIRNYGAANRDKKLFYSEAIIRAFISSLAASETHSRLIILQGLSGSGKSSLPELFKDALCFGGKSIPVQPSWRDKNELLGYDNDFTNRFKETDFTKAVYKASLRQNQNQVHLIVLDEMNLARIEYYFADFLSQLEKDKKEWLISLISNYNEENPENKPEGLNYKDGTANLIVSENIWFIGTANNDDSTSTITDKVYDRGQVLDMDSREPDFEAQKESPKYLSYTRLKYMFDAAKAKKENCLTEEELFDIEILDDILKKIDNTFGNRMKTQLENFVPVYVSCGGTKEEAIDYFLAHKILRKLDGKFEPYILKHLKELYEELENRYPKTNISREKILKIKKRNFSIDEDEKWELK